MPDLKQQEANSGQIKVGLIGYGYSGATFQAPLIKAVTLLRLAMVCSSKPDLVRRDFPGMTVVADPAALISSSEIDLVVIATTNTTHFALAKQALLAGKHVVVEKPFTVTVHEALELVALAEREQRVLSVFHNRRWDNDFLTLQAAIASGVLGPVNTMMSHFDRYRPAVRQRWREQDLPGSGILYDLGSHLIDQALVLFGQPDSVACDMGIQREAGLADDYVHLTLRYGARRVMLHAAMLVPQAGPRFTVHGALGSFVKHGLDPQESALLRGEGPGSRDWGVEDAALHAHLTLYKGELQVAGRTPSLPGCYEAYYQGMVDAITMGKPAPVSARDGLAVMKVIELAKRSHMEQRCLPFE